jgi:hypothetical protein
MPAKQSIDLRLRAEALFILLLQLQALAAFWA